MDIFYDILLMFCETAEPNETGGEIGHDRQCAMTGAANSIGIETGLGFCSCPEPRLSGSTSPADRHDPFII
jgi:hypothetical protein